MNPSSLVLLAFIVLTFTAIRDAAEKRLRTSLIIFGSAAIGFALCILGSYTGFGSAEIWGHAAVPVTLLAGSWAAFRKNREFGWKSWRSKKN
jgi:hypothetical protein